MMTLNDGRSELWQWDTGRKLAVDAECSQVHFSNKVFGRSIDVDVADGVAIIPDVLLQTDKELIAWAFVGTAENGYTKISKVFKVNKRNKPADYVFTPTEQTTLGELIERLDKIEESQDLDAIKNAVDDYLANNPIEIDETDPTVPEWAKQPTKPIYTASEVGALPADTVIPTIPDNVSAFRNDAGYLTEHQDLTGYATEKYVHGYAQPKGDYLTEVPDAYATKEFVTNKIAEAELGGEEVDLSGYAQKSELPTKVSQLENDSGYLTEHQDISGKLDANKLPEAINTALAQAKASGEFDGRDGIDATPVTPLFANTIEECTDTTKPYVLPDGYIYAYMMTEVTEEVNAYENKLLTSVDADGTPYNGGQGWKSGTRLNSSGVESTSNAADIEVTGFIPAKLNDTIYLKDIVIREKGSNEYTYATQTYFAVYDANKTKLYSQQLGYLDIGSVATSGNGITLDAPNGNIIEMHPSEMYDGRSADWRKADMAFFRLSCEEITADSIITVNEEIKNTTVTTKKEGWANTGHAFVPADYEGRIIAVEEASAENENRIEANEIRIANLENRSVDGVPDYVIAEAEEVIDKVIAAQGNKTFTFAAITDMHYGNASYTDGLIHACQAMQYIDSRIKLDAVSVLGDYTDGFTGTGYDNAIGDFKAINAELNGLRFAPNLRVHGNHDHYEPNSPILHRYITAYSDDVVWGSKLGGYFYRDFKDFKLRIICLNTAEENKDGLSCSVAQYNWFVDALDLSSKEDVAEWQTLILSHHPLDWFISVDGGYVLWQILNAYLNGTSWTNTQGTAISCNFAGKNSARIIGNIHGHIHNLLTRKIAAGRPNATADTINVVRIATPEACYNRPNGYNGLWDYNPFGEETSYPKTQGTAEDTAFCIYCVDLDAHTVKAICYGAGYDREISY